MPATHRDFPYIRTVWLPELLTSERSCEWAVWFQANFQNWDRVPSDCDQTQNACRLRGHNPVLTGQPNLIIPSGENVRVVDVKDGADIMVYTCAPLRACPQRKEARIAGAIHYPKRIYLVRQGGFTQDCIRRMSSSTYRAPSRRPIPRVPSIAEWQFCNIAIDHRPDLVDRKNHHRL